MSSASESNPTDQPASSSAETKKPSTADPMMPPPSVPPGRTTEKQNEEETSGTTATNLGSSVGKTVATTSSCGQILSLHDCLSLGEIELGLVQKEGSSRRDEIQRLPLLLRVLSLTRPLASISILEKENDGSEEDVGDPLVNRTVERLEHVAATHSVAEGVDVVTCHLAPSMSRKLSKLPPLEHKNGEWDTKALAAVARNPKSTKRKLSKTDDIECQQQGPDDGIQGLSEDEGDYVEEDQGEEGHQSLPNKKRRRSLTRRDSMEVAAEDSQEATVTKTLSELASLVVSSLEPISQPHSHDTEEETRGKEQLALTIDDSILSESARGDAEGGAMEGSDLGSTVTAIMHHAPVLRSRHVANALCRAAIPQAGDLMTRMGANCPASVPSLLLGCVEAYSLAITHGNSSIANVAKQGTRALAKLSVRERSRVRNKLLALGIMFDVQLILAMEADATSTACLLIMHLTGDERLASQSKNDTGRNGKEESRHKSEQTSGDASSDFRSREKAYSPISEGQEPTLQLLLLSKPVLYRDTLSFFANEFARVVTHFEAISTGKLRLLLKAYGWLLLVPAKKSPKCDPAQYLLETLLPKLKSLVEKIKERVAAEKSKDAQTLVDGNVLNLLRCTLVLTLARILDGSDQPNVATESSTEVLTLMRELPSLSKKSDGFRYCLDNAVNDCNPFSLFQHIMETLTGSKIQDHQRSKGSFPAIESGLQTLCDLSQDESSRKVNDDQEIDLESRLSSLMLAIQEVSGDADESLVSRSETTLRSVLSDNGLASFIQNDIISLFVTEATKFLSSKEKLKVPLVMSSQLEMLAYKLTFARRLAGESPDNMESKFFLQILHAFEYLDQDARSPFAFDPRSLPMREALNLSKALSNPLKTHFLESRLHELVGKHCPDILAQARLLEFQREERCSTRFDSISRSEIIDSLYFSLRSFVEGSKNDDEDAYSMEGMFLQAKSRLSDADLCCTVVSSFLAFKNKPRPSLTYPRLCRDPLVIFKCPMKVWRCKGLRRIVLTILLSLLESNSAIITNASPFEESADELIAARNALVVRCLLVMMSGVDADVSVSHCSMTTSVIRSLVKGHHGLVALLIKQGLPENALDWLVEYVPETMNDSQDLLNLLSQQSSLTPAERLVAADAVIRIAIVHGHCNETEAGYMVYSALSQLVDSFFLVVGPVGVPVIALISGESGLDITQIARQAAFRILKSLLKVRGRRAGLRRECGMALQKLASLCKGESAFSGLANAVAGRRKALLKEIFDAAMKAANAMGSCIGSSTAAA